MLDHESEARVRGLSQQIDAHTFSAMLVQNIPQIGCPKNSQINMRALAKRWWRCGVRGPVWWHVLHHIRALQLSVRCFTVGGSRVRVVSIPVFQRGNEHSNGITDQVLWHCSDMQCKDVVGLAAGIVAATLRRLRIRLRRYVTIICPKPVVEEPAQAQHGDER